jgi:hypothetical protein
MGSKLYVGKIRGRSVRVNEAQDKRGGGRGGYDRR